MHLAFDSISRAPKSKDITDSHFKMQPQLSNDRIVMIPETNSFGYCGYALRQVESFRNAK